MSSSPPLKLMLRHIRPLQSSDGTGFPDIYAESLLGTTQLPEEVARLVSSRVDVHVGAECGTSAAGQTFSCPLFILQAASSTLRDVLLDVVDAPAGTGTPAAPSAVVPLPFMSPSTFVTAALYMEHFYGFGADQLMGMDDSGASAAHMSGENAQHRRSTTGLAVQAEVQHPTEFHVPLLVGDLYHLSPWEHRFVVQRLLRAEASSWDALIADGAWVDLLAQRHVVMKDKNTKADMGLSDEQQRTCVDELVATLEASTRLGIPPLQSLCAAVLSNMLIDRSEEELLSLLSKGPKVGHPSRSPLTAEKKKELLSQFPWLQGTSSV